MIFEAVFRESLESHGLSVNKLQLGKKIESKDTILVHQSKPLYILLENMMHDSKNLTSELLLKYIGITDSSVGTWESSTESKTYAFLKKFNIDTSALRIADGSGLKIQSSYC